MRIEGSYTFDVSRERLWGHLMDPSALAACIPGCRRFTPLAADRFEVELQVGIGAISGSYKGTVTVTDVDEPVSYRMTVEGKGARTTISGTGTVTLSEAGDGTEVTYEGDGKVSGMLARVRPETNGHSRERTDQSVFRVRKLPDRCRSSTPIRAPDPAGDREHTPLY